MNNHRRHIRAIRPLFFVLAASMTLCACFEAAELPPIETETGGSSATATGGTEPNGGTVATGGATTSGGSVAGPETGGTLQAPAPTGGADDLGDMDAGSASEFDAGMDAGPECDADVQTDRENCGSCGSVCGNGMACEAGVCKQKCGDGVVDRDLGEQCDAGKNVYGCTACKMTGPYATPCDQVGLMPDGFCYTFGTGTGESPGLVLPLADMDDMSCPPVPGADYVTKNYLSGACVLDCVVDEDCPVDWICHQGVYCWVPY